MSKYKLPSDGTDCDKLYSDVCVENDQMQATITTLTAELEVGRKGRETMHGLYSECNSERLQSESALTAEQAKSAGLEVALQKYGHHLLGSCQTYYQSEEPKCLCGFDKALQQGDKPADKQECKKCGGSKEIKVMPRPDIDELEKMVNAGIYDFKPDGNIYKPCPICQKEGK